MTIPLSKEAVKLLGRVKKRGPVFPELTEYVINKYLPKLISDAGITKHITFHCFRHTFAMRLLDKGVDIYTIAKLLGHTMVTSTQYYAVVSNERARQIIEMLEKEE